MKLELYYRQVSSRQYLIPGNITHYVGRTYDMNHGGDQQRWDKVLTASKSEEFDREFQKFIVSNEIHVIVITSPILMRDEEYSCTINRKASYSRFKSDI